MASWSTIAAAEPDLAAAVMARFDAHLHKVMATLRRDGAPRVSGTELHLVDGDLWLGSMPGARKARDLQHDPRVAVHSATVDPDLDATGGDAKVAGLAVEVTDRAEVARFEAGMAAPEDPDGYHLPPGSHLFRLDVREVVLTGVGDPPDHLVVDSWHEGRGRHRAEVR